MPFNRCRLTFVAKLPLSQEQEASARTRCLASQRRRPGCARRRGRAPRQEGQKRTRTYRPALLGHVPSALITGHADAAGPPQAAGAKWSARRHVASGSGGATPRSAASAATSPVASQRPRLREALRCRGRPASRRGAPCRRGRHGVRGGVGLCLGAKLSCAADMAPCSSEEPHEPWRSARPDS